ncbi:MAG: pyridinium-3,5-bisthiocarboxylic acid mononucleotide nickel chelatase [Pseudonocardiales bacterium]|nr:pyridinium-3,5-bisthiocarboxylic acid mononucleotide nickel chelatase [Pseudonocardiales bacterium]
MIVWFNPVSGVSGDMLLGALLELGAPLDDIRAAVAATGLTGWTLDTQRVRRGALLATRARVRVADDVPARRAAELREMVGRARPAPVAELAGRAIEAIAQVEAGLHGVPVAEVHLHEIGGVDTVVDTVGVAAALHLLDVAEVVCGPLALGSGVVGGSHGLLPLPAPATAALLARAGASVMSTGLPGETVTPTGIALLLAAGARFGPVPDMTVRAVGYGAGGRDVPERPNVLQALLGAAATAPAAGDVRPMTVLETTVDDVTGEVLGYVIEQVLAAGAADAWITPAVMKKSRPGHTLAVLVTPERAADIEALVLRETGSLGLRRRTVDRVALPRRTTTVDVDGHPVRLKHGPWGAKPEHDDVARAAAALGLPLREVAARARSAGSAWVDDELDLGR